MRLCPLPKAIPGGSREQGRAGGGGLLHRLVWVSGRGAGPRMVMIKGQMLLGAAVIYHSYSTLGSCDVGFRHVFDPRLPALLPLLLGHAAST